MQPLESSELLYDGRLTSYVLLASVVAASGGLLFGYDIGVTGGVVSMSQFLQKFFPDVYFKQQAPSTAKSAYCKFDSQILSLFTSSLFIAAIFGGFLGCYTTVRVGRVKTMLFSGLFFLAGAIICGSAVNVIMLVAGRVILGVAVGMASQVCYLCSIPVRSTGMALCRTSSIFSTNDLIYQNCMSNSRFQTVSSRYIPSKPGYGYRRSTPLNNGR